MFTVKGSPSRRGLCRIEEIPTRVGVESRVENSNILLSEIKGQI